MSYFSDNLAQIDKEASIILLVVSQLIPNRRVVSDHFLLLSQRPCPEQAAVGARELE